MKTKYTGLHLWKVSIRARVNSFCNAQIIKLWITTNTRGIADASDKTNRFLHSKEGRKNYSMATISAVKYRGTIDA